MNSFKKFSNYSRLKPNISKCEIAGVGILKGVKMALCGMVCIDLTKDTVKILGIHYSYNTQTQIEKNFIEHIKAIERMLRVWRMHNL